MSPYLHLLPAALCAVGAIWQTCEAAHEWRMNTASINPDRGRVAQAATLAALCFAGFAISLAPALAHAVSTGAAR